MSIIVGGMPVGRDGRVHTTFTHNPSTLRLSSVDPNLQNIPRGGGEGVDQWVKDMFVAPEGALLWERDFSAIEAVLVGYFAGDPTYVKFAKLGVHDYLLSHMLGEPADLSMSDRDLKALFKALKARHKALRDNAKRVVHGSNYMMTARRMHELFPESFPSTRDAARLQGLYFDLFPSIRRWHRDLCLRVDGSKRRSATDGGETVDPWTLGVCYARNPFGYVHHFYNVLDWQKVGTEWVWTFGEDAKRLVAFLPQSTAAAIIKRAARTLWDVYPWVGRSMRLLVHDSIVGECAERDLETCLRVSGDVMGAPIEELPLDPAWGMGQSLVINSEAKVGRSWGAMEEVK